VLDAGYQSSVEGLHFAGATAATSFGPLMRFVVGTWYAAPTLAGRLAGDRRRALRLSFPTRRIRNVGHHSPR
jgi:FAD-dependent urate hydroxylase